MRGLGPVCGPDQTHRVIPCSRPFSCASYSICTSFSPLHCIAACASPGSAYGKQGWSRARYIQHADWSRVHAACGTWTRPTLCTGSGLQAQSTNLIQPWVWCAGLVWHRCIQYPPHSGLDTIYSTPSPAPICCKQHVVAQTGHDMKYTGLIRSTFHLVPVLNWLCTLALAQTASLWAHLGLVLDSACRVNLAWALHVTHPRLASCAASSPHWLQPPWRVQPVPDGQRYMQHAVPRPRGSTAGWMMGIYRSSLQTVRLNPQYKPVAFYYYTDKCLSACQDGIPQLYDVLARAWKNIWDSQYTEKIFLKITLKIHLSIIIENCNLWEP